MTSPMLATPTKAVPAGPEWLHEVKWDGVRVLLDVRGGPGGPGGSGGSGGTGRLTSRNGNVTTPAWPELAESPLGERDVMLDGEIIALNEKGIPDFRVLQHRMHVRKASEVARLVERVPVTLMAFDLLRLDGEDLTALPLEERRDRLAGLGLEQTRWAVPDAYDDGAMLLEATRAQGLEGVVSKRRRSAYRPGVRSPDWLKLAHRHRGSYVVGGWRPQVGTEDRLAAVLVGQPTPDGLLYRGRVGSGISGATARRLQALLEPLSASSSPFADEVPRVDATGTHWVSPVVVVDVDTHGAGYDRLRQPSFQGVRSDVDADDLEGPA